MGGLAFALFAVLQISSLAFDLPSCSPGFSSDSFHFRVGRKRLHSGMRLGKVEFSDCTDRRRFLFSSEDSKFSVQTDGVVTVKRALELHHRHKDFSVHVWDSEGNKFTVPVRVQNHHHENHHEEGHQPQAEGRQQENHHTQTMAPAADAAPAVIRHRRETSGSEVIFFPKATKGLKRKKREWVIPDINFAENHRGPFPQKVSQIRSSDDKERVIYYSITGPGADQPPNGLFTMDKFSGILYVTQPLDREAKANYTFLAHAVAAGSGQAEKPMDIKVIVIDMNDNKPIFTQNTYIGEVAESSPINFDILQVTAKDADEEDNYNSLIKYKIINQEPKSPSNDMFAINPVNGVIRVNAGGLDREKNPKYTVEVQAADLDGNGLTGNAKVILTVTDSNDNAPVYTQTQFTSSIPENKKDAVVVKMQVTDEDDAHTPAWNAKFTIVHGDPNNLFTVATGTNKQEGIITTAKGLDFEMTQTHTLVVAVENEVPFAISLPTATATVVVTVTDVNEAPIFEPAVKLVSKPENLPVDMEVVQYAAYDPDTARKQKVMYRVVSDPAGWLNIAKETGLVTVKTEMDRESLFVKDDIYTVLIGAYDNDEHPATGTGTLQIKLEDVNDNGPTIEERDFRVCYKEPGPQLLTVTDKDGPGFSAPFKVSLEGSSKNNWTARMNETSETDAHTANETQTHTPPMRHRRTHTPPMRHRRTHTPPMRHRRTHTPPMRRRRTHRQ
uniref:Cadherin domain-containing protein n=1 Tax=Knipowitschia caucasica TaxID=637954 RepID=A0AAV2JPA8_KNICA